MNRGDELLLDYIKSLQLSNKNTISFLRIDEGKLLIIFFKLKTALVIGDIFKIKELLSGYLLTKNAGLLGRCTNLLVIFICCIANKLPKKLFPKKKMNCDYHLLSWRQGIRYRFIDLDKKTIIDYCFENENENLKKEINIRLNYGDILPISQLIDYKADGTYFLQRYEDAKSVSSQISNQSLVFDSVITSFEQLQKMYLTTKRTVNFMNYRARLEKRILNSNLMPKSIVNRISKLSKKIDWGNVDCSLDIVNSHGDLNLGNVLVTSDKQIILIDWERSDVRSITHDFFNLFWFLEYVHRADRLLISELNKQLQSMAIFKIIEENRIACEYIFFLERVYMWTCYKNSTNSWLNKLTDIIEDKVGR